MRIWYIVFNENDLQLKIIIIIQSLILSVLLNNKTWMKGFQFSKGANIS